MPDDFERHTVFQGTMNRNTYHLDIQGNRTHHLTGQETPGLEFPMVGRKPSGRKTV
jgi:hypothetical protein